MFDLCGVGHILMVFNRGGIHSLPLVPLPRGLRRTYGFTKCFHATGFSIGIVFDRWVVIDLRVSLSAIGSIASRLKENLRLHEVLPARPSLPLFHARHSVHPSNFGMAMDELACG